MIRIIQYLQNLRNQPNDDTIIQAKNTHGIPFYVTAPLSTIDMESKAEDVIIKMRNGSEVTGIGDKKTAPEGINVINPAFDITPQN